MPQCFLCKKGNLRNLQVSHSKHRTKKIRRPNLHSYKMVVNGKNKRVKLCIKCLRRVKNKESQKPAPIKKGNGKKA